MIIIGAGIAGLAAGCYARMNGYSTRILELHTLPGGLCTAWKRKGYTFDGCVQQIIGSSPSVNPAWYRIWEELGAVQGRQMIHHEESMSVEGKGGKILHVYADIDRLQQHLLELSPGDRPVIDELCAGVRKFAGYKPPILIPRELFGPLDGMKAGLGVLPYLFAMRKYMTISWEEFTGRFQDPFLREASAIVFDQPGFPLLTAMFSLAFHHNNMAGFPGGGSLAFARSIEGRYLDLGGTIDYGARVQRIVVENDRAVGVLLEDGTELRADVIVSAADGRSTVFEMLDGLYADDRIRSYYDSWPTFRPVVQVSLGVDRDFSAEPHRRVFPLEQPLDIFGEQKHYLCLKHFCFDPQLAPAGKSVLSTMFTCEYEPWKELYADRRAYRAAKERVGEEVLDRLEARHPGLRDHVEVMDVTSPITYERYTANWKGSMEGWRVDTQTMPRMIKKAMSKTLPGLDRFYMAGQWVEPGGGVPAVALSGRNVIQLICHADGLPFRAETPAAQSPE